MTHLPASASVSRSDTGGGVVEGTTSASEPPLCPSSAPRPDQPAQGAAEETEAGAAAEDEPISPMLGEAGGGRPSAFPQQVRLFPPLAAAI